MFPCAVFFDENFLFSIFVKSIFSFLSIVSETKCDRVDKIVVGIVECDFFTEIHHLMRVKAFFRYS